MKIRSADAKYEKGDDVLSAYQRGEVIELDTDTNRVHVVGHWTDYHIANAAVSLFNKLEEGKQQLIEAHEKELQRFRWQQEAAFQRALKKQTHCQCENCVAV